MLKKIFKWFKNMHRHHAKIVGGCIEVGDSFGVFFTDSLVGGYVAIFFSLDHMMSEWFEDDFNIKKDLVCYHFSGEYNPELDMWVCPELDKRIKGMKYDTL